MIKRCWHFRTITGKGGTMILLDPVGHDEALRECVDSLGDQIIRVY